MFDGMQEVCNDRKFAQVTNKHSQKHVSHGVERKDKRPKRADWRQQLARSNINRNIGTYQTKATRPINRTQQHDVADHVRLQGKMIVNKK